MSDYTLADALDTALDSWRKRCTNCVSGEDYCPMWNLGMNEANCPICEQKEAPHDHAK